MLLKSDQKLIAGLFTGNFNSKFSWANSQDSAHNIIYSNHKKSHVLKISDKDNKSEIIKIVYNLIKNRDGSVRWLQLNNESDARFLKFYNANSFKSKLYGFVLKGIYKTKLNSFTISDKLEIEVSANNPFAKILNDLALDKHSIFLGTVGPNRKIIIEGETKLQEQYFIKIPTSNNAQELIRNEEKMLKQFPLTEKIAIPILHKNDLDILIQSTDNQLTNLVRPNFFNKILESFLITNYCNSKKKDKLINSKFYFKINSNMLKLKAHSLKSDLQNCYQILCKVIENLDANTSYEFHLAHGDFTSWNMYLGKNQLYVYDWELSLNEAPLYFDFFHFHFQNGILQKQQNFASILKLLEIEIEKIEEYNNLHQYKNDWKKYLSLYIIYTSSYYLNIFEKQQNLHQQAYWLLNVWNDGLTWISEMSKPSLDKIAFTKLFFDYLNIGKLNYAWLKSKGENLENINPNSDVDLLIEKNDYKKLKIFLTENSSVKQVKEVKQSFMSTLELYLKTGEILHLDLIWQFKRKALIYLDAAKILSNTINNLQGIKMPNVQDDFEYSVSLGRRNES